MDFKEIASQNFVLWVEALQTNDPKKVAEMYTADNTFLPTLSADFKKGKQAAERYFVHFLEKKPVGKIVSEEIQPLGEDSYLHCGMYDFEVGADGNRSIVPARFTFTWRKEPDGKWKIFHHHSSVKPQ